MAEDIAKRLEVCRRHGISEGLAGELHGSTPAEWEADAAARASIARMFGGGQPEPEPEVLLRGKQTPPTEEPAPPEPVAAEPTYEDVIAHLLRPKHADLIHRLHPEKEQ